MTKIKTPRFTYDVETYILDENYKLETFLETFQTGADALIAVEKAVAAGQGYAVIRRSKDGRGKALKLALVSV